MVDLKDSIVSGGRDASANVGSNAKEGNFPRHAQANGMQGESKLELFGFGFDPLVNILGLKSMIDYWTSICCNMSYWAASGSTCEK
ncbi:hypothetical protein K1719_025034 [Acacia pycnantha]|nr:hypothetical protein K1719_025034 [Acacia pycnantha]